MKVLLAAPLPPPYGGIANWVVLLRELLERDAESCLCGVVDTSPGKRGVDGRTLWDRMVVQGLDMFRLRRQLAEQFRRARPDVLHITTSGQLAIIRDILFLRTARQYNIPAVYHIHFGRVPDMLRGNTLEWRLMKRAIDLAGAVVAIDGRTAAALGERLPGDKLHHIPNPIALSGLEPGKDVPEREVMFLGWCVPAKGIEELLTAWDRLSRQYPAWTLRLVGPCDPAYREALSGRHDLTRVIFEGELPHDQAMERLERAAVFTLPSYTEGFPNAVLEAMALGKPIVATDVGAMPEMLEGDCGLVVPARDSEALGQALESLLKEPDRREYLGNQSRKRLETRYESGLVFAQYKAMWKALCAVN